MNKLGTLILFLLIVVFCGCGTVGEHLAYPVSKEEALMTIETLQDGEHHLKRPLVLVGGWRDPGFGTGRMMHTFSKIFPDAEIIKVNFGWQRNFETCREKLIDAVDAQFPVSDPVWTEEVDVVAISMGGLVARYAGIEMEGERRLRIRRLYTIATPHRGAKLADTIVVDSFSRDMQPESEFIAMLSSRDQYRAYQITSYVREGDAIVGEAYAAPAGEMLVTVPNIPFQFAHLNAARDPRIIADILEDLKKDGIKDENHFR